MGSIVASGLVMSRQALWLKAIERRITATTAMLGAMKGVKMCGLTDILSKTLQDLRVSELRISKKFRKILVWNMAFSTNFETSIPRAPG
jgi:ATP-binding cassette subfamily C (CFTR/MRP) protein 1